MLPAATRLTTTGSDNARPTPTVYLAFELGNRDWKLGFTTGFGQPPRERTIAARDLSALAIELTQAKRRFALPADAPVLSCYEAGRDGFWLHRYLTSIGIENAVVDSSSIEVKRRLRRAKSDGLDVRKLLGMLLRYHAGERDVWSVVRVPTVEEEDRRQLHRELLRPFPGRRQADGRDLPTHTFGMAQRLGQIRRGLHVYESIQARDLELRVGLVDDLAYILGGRGR